MRIWYAGIDWANEHHDALVIDETGRQVGSLRVDHNPQGMSRLNTFLEQSIGAESKEQMTCIIETTHGLLIAHLLEAGWPVYPVNPRTVDSRRSASGVKTDTIDAYVLAKTGRTDVTDLHRLTPDSEQIAELKLLTRDQDANASGQSAHRAPQSLLPGGPGLVRESAAKEHLAVLANLPHATGRDDRFG